MKDFASSIAITKGVAYDISDLSSVTSEIPLSRLDYWEKLIRREYGESINQLSSSKWKLWRKPISILTWVDLISWDGYKRENTLRSISGGAPNSFFMLLVIRRLNDWVPQVRSAARDQLALIANRTNPDYFAEAVCVALTNWNTWGRIRKEDRNSLLEVLSSHRIADALKSTIISSATGPMAKFVSQLGRTTILDDFLIELSQDAIQPAVRAKAYRCLFEKRMVWTEGRKWEWTDIRYCEGKYVPIVGEREIFISTSFVELLKSAIEDKSPIVRRVAAEFLIRESDTLETESIKLAESLATDNSYSVAERGKFALEKLAGIHNLDSAS